MVYIYTSWKMVGKRMAGRHDITPGVLMDLLVNSSLVCKILARYQESGDRLERAARVAESSGDLLRGYRVAAERAALCYIRGRLDEGLQLARRVIGAEGCQAGESRASCLNTEGNIHLRRCEFEQAEDSFRRALELYQGTGRELSVGITLNNLGNIHNIRGESQGALELYHRALEIFQRFGDSFRTAHVLHAICQMQQYQRDFAQARSYQMRSLELRHRMQDYRGIVNGLLVLAVIETDLLNYEAALERLLEADALIETHGLREPHILAFRHGTAGTLYFDTGEFDKAETCFIELIEISRGMGSVEFLSGGHNWLGKTRVTRDKSELGLADIRQGLEIAAARGLTVQEQDGWNFMALCCRLLGKKEESLRAAERYAEISRRMGVPEDSLRENLRILTDGA